MWHTMHSEKKTEEKAGSGEGEIAQGDLVGNFVRRTDNDFRGVKDQSLIGKDVGEEEDEDGDKET